MDRRQGLSKKQLNVLGRMPVDLDTHPPITVHPARSIFSPRERAVQPSHGEK